MIEEEQKNRYRAYHNAWQNAKYKKDSKYRELKKKIALEWRKKNIEKFREYQRNYQKKRRESKINEAA